MEYIRHPGAGFRLYPRAIYSFHQTSGPDVAAPCHHPDDEINHRAVYESIPSYDLPKSI
jgi:hypothetical protein